MSRIGINLVQAALTCGLFYSNLAAATVVIFDYPIKVINPYAIYETRSANDIGITPGDKIRIGASQAWVQDTNGNIIDHPTAIGYNGTTNVQVTHYNLPINPHHYDGATPDTSLTSPWTIDFMYGTKTVSVVTNATAPAPAPFATSVTASGSGATPTFTWTVPGTYQPDAVWLNVYNKDLGGESAVHHVRLPGTTRSYSLPTQLSAPGHSLTPNTRGYVVEISLLDQHVPDWNSLHENTAGRSRAFFDFNVLGSNAPQNVHLPTTNAGVHNFHVAAVTQGVTIFIDPLVAIGYDYAVGVNDPWFESVTLPSVGDDLFDLYLFDLNVNDWIFEATLQAGIQHMFGPNGVDRFRILGIEAAAMLDPSDGTAFITGVSFVSDGQFTGTMTPISAEVPVPAAWSLLLLGLLSIHCVRKRRPSTELQV